MLRDQESINEQLELLAQHRRTLAHLLEQAAAYGGIVFAPPQTANGIEDARANISRIKTILRETGIQVEDQPNDEVPPLTRPIHLQKPFEPETILITDGKFLMGSDGGDGVRDDEKPRHEVILPDYYISKYPVTNAQYLEYVRQTNSAVAGEAGWVLPFVSNCALASIFGNDPTVVAMSWADEIGSPLSEQENRDLARVAQFYSVRVKSMRQAKLDYHLALKGYLLVMAQNDPSADREYIAELAQDMDKLQAVSFSEIARNLGYPKFDDPMRNPLRLLAELPLPIYVTTSQHTFLEAALAQTGHKKPVTEIFYWDDTLQNIPSIFETEPDYKPTFTRPLVYHLFGLDTYPESMVLSEDDYLSVLMKLSGLKREVKVGESAHAGMSGMKYDIPSDIKTALSGSGLLLLGYNIYDWEFRVLFKWLVQYIGESRAGRGAPEGICMQLQPNKEADKDEKNQKIREYLKDFFGQKSFTIYWGNLQSCVYDLWMRGKDS